MFIQRRGVGQEKYDYWIMVDKLFCCIYLKSFDYLQSLLHSFQLLLKEVNKLTKLCLISTHWLLDQAGKFTPGTSEGKVRHKMSWRWGTWLRGLQRMIGGGCSGGWLVPGWRLSHLSSTGGFKSLLAFNSLKKLRYSYFMMQIYLEFLDIC